jgi:hypothetical protein
MYLGTKATGGANVGVGVGIGVGVLAAVGLEEIVGDGIAACVSALAVEMSASDGPQAISITTRNRKK